MGPASRESARGAASDHEPRAQAMRRAADAVGGLMEFWGFKRNMGRMWCVLYLSERPLSAGDLGQALSLSAGAVSMTLSALLRWGAVKKAWVPGERRDYYEPETSIWKMVSRVFRERELRQIHLSIEAFEQASAELARQRRTATLAETQEVDFARNRLQSLLDLARIGEGLVGAVLAGESVDASPLVAFRKPDQE